LIQIEAIHYEGTMAFTIRSVPSKDSIQAFADRFPEADPKAIDLTLRLLICSAELEEMMNLHFSEYDLSQTRFSAMMMLFRSPDRTAKPIDMADHLGVTRGNMTGVLDNLERDGMVTRQNDDQDRRVNSVRLTDKGYKHLMKMLPTHFTRIRKLVQPLTKSERETFINCLEKLRGAMDQFQKKT
jgi:DNA-binding MarR family transcriptional regulator